jgi:hypothetical protein
MRTNQEQYRVAIASAEICLNAALPEKAAVEGLF